LAATHISRVNSPQWLDIDQNNLCMKFSALNVDFGNRLSRFKEACARMSKRGAPLKSGYLSAVSLSSVKMVADRHKHAAYHNKHWRRAS